MFVCDTVCERESRRGGVSINDRHTVNVLGGARYPVTQIPRNTQTECLPRLRLRLSRLGSTKAILRLCVCVCVCDTYIHIHEYTVTSQVGSGGLGLVSKGHNAMVTSNKMFSYGLSSWFISVHFV